MNKLTVSASPHKHTHATTQKIMLDVLIALVPALVASTNHFGLRALLLAFVCVASCVLAEFLSRLIMKRNNTISDLSAAVTGLILALNLPVGLPLWMAVFGSVVAIVVVKQFFGGVGHNFANPAMTARIVLMLCFASQMTAWVAPNTVAADAVTSASPLAMLSDLNNVDTNSLPSLWQMLLGARAGSMGETCIIALVLGGAYLVIRKVITVTVPLTFIGTVGVCMLIATRFNLTLTAYELLSGGLFLGAIFMATDYATSPITPLGQVVFGVGCGLLTSFIRLFGSLPEGVSYSILLMNILTPHIDNFTQRKPFAPKKKEAKN